MNGVDVNSLGGFALCAVLGGFVVGVGYLAVMAIFGRN
jgi:hypothetical protein